jgi:nucleoside phosphorylase
VICIVTALRSEARPMIEYLGLSPDVTWEGGRHFSGDDVHLVVSGIGADKARRAIGRLALRVPDPEGAAWLNVGLAGHRSHEIGSVFRATIVENAATGEVWEVADPGAPGLPPPAVVVTVEEPELEYPGDALYDMEAAAFFAAASRCSPAQPIQLLKVVSDNREHPVSRITPAIAERLVRDALPAVSGMIGALRSR